MQLFLTRLKQNLKKVSKHPISRLDSRLISIYFCDKLKISQLCHNQKNTEKFTNFINFAVQIKI